MSNAISAVADGVSQLFKLNALLVGTNFIAVSLSAFSVRFQSADRGSNCSSRAILNLRWRSGRLLSWLRSSRLMCASISSLVLRLDLNRPLWRPCACWTIWAILAFEELILQTTSLWSVRMPMSSLGLQVLVADSSSTGRRTKSFMWGCPVPGWHQVHQRVRLLMVLACCQDWSILSPSSLQKAMNFPQLGVLGPILRELPSTRGLRSCSPATSFPRFMLKSPITGTR